MHMLNAPRVILSAKPRTYHCLGPVQTIALEEAEKAGITLPQILGAQRCQKLVRPRHKAMWRAARETLANLCEIGRVFNRDHTTVMYAIAKVDAEIKASHV